MGAAPNRAIQQAAASPQRDFEGLQTISIATARKPGPRRFARVPTYAIGVAQERRCNPRAKLSLPLRLIRVEDVPEAYPVTLVTRNISSSGIFFLAPRDFKPGTAIELEVALVDRPLGMGRVQMYTAAHIVRSEDVEVPGWRGYAASFDDFALRHDDSVPVR